MYIYVNIYAYTYVPVVCAGGCYGARNGEPHRVAFRPMTLYKFICVYIYVCICMYTYIHACMRVPTGRSRMWLPRRSQLEAASSHTESDNSAGGQPRLL